MCSTINLNCYTHFKLYGQKNSYFVNNSGVSWITEFVRWLMSCKQRWLIYKVFIKLLRIFYGMRKIISKNRDVVYFSPQWPWTKSLKVNWEDKAKVGSSHFSEMLIFQMFLQTKNFFSFRATWFCFTPISRRLLFVFLIEGLFGYMSDNVIMM